MSTRSFVYTVVSATSSVLDSADGRETIEAPRGAFGICQRGGKFVLVPGKTTVDQFIAQSFDSVCFANPKQ